ncbi:hypothetical protein [Bombilactobacillus bombi]|uniref:hypothetical protein n=1 Tax=Bombilactobacillus bombi TaxID=1303590 RepID=UPI0015E5F13A|nr:hypothetical protein [Bombilactobacillus bombi]
MFKKLAFDRNFYKKQQFYFSLLFVPLLTHALLAHADLSICGPLSLATFIEIVFTLF